MEDKCNKKEKIVIVGGGIAGLTVAHELVQKLGSEFQIVIYEKNKNIGGKARTQWKDGKFSEHSMRVLPGSYVCMHQIMQEIPHGSGTVIERLKPVTIELRHKNRTFTILGDYRTRFLGSLKYLKDVIGLIWFLNRIGVGLRDLVVFLGKIGILLILPYRRVTEDLSRLNFAEYIGGDGHKCNRFSVIYRLAEILVAAKSYSSAGVVSHTLLEWFVTPFLKGKYARSAISEFDMATSDALIIPWKKFLESKGVKFENAWVKKIDSQAGRVSEMQLKDGSSVTGDVFVMAVQHNVAAAMIGADLHHHVTAPVSFSELGEEWAHSVQFQIPKLPEKFQQLGSTAIAVMDSPWSIAYRVYSESTWEGTWKGAPGGGVFTATISNTKRAGTKFNLPFLRCTREQVLQEVIAQTGLENELDFDHGEIGLDLQIHDREDAMNCTNQGFAVADIGGNSNKVFVTGAQMYIRLPGNLDNEPVNTTGVYNFFLAGEYTKTKYRIPTMEKSCESGKRCAQAILESLGRQPRDVPVCNLPLGLLRSEYFHMLIPRIFWLGIAVATIWLVVKQVFFP